MTVFLLSLESARQVWPLHNNSHISKKESFFFCQIIWQQSHSQTTKKNTVKNEINASANERRKPRQLPPHTHLAQVELDLIPSRPAATQCN